MNQTSVLAGPAVLPPGLAEPDPASANDRRRLAASLLAFQAAMYFVTAVEAAAMSVISGPAGWGRSSFPCSSWSRSSDARTG